jgi:5-methylcytosine-specific restriction enzyme A
MSKEQPNELQRVVRSFLRDLIVAKHQPKLKKIAVQDVHSKRTEPTRKRNVTLKVRMQVLKRDSFQCVCCGRKPPEVVLEVDHKIPFSKGGSNHITNLQTLCFDCNRGKSNHF